MKAVIYARYSSDLQSKASIEDQVRVCRERADKMEFEVVDVFTDPALSGSRLQNRPSLQKLLEWARAPGSFDVVITEALDRLSRDQEDIAGLFKRLAHLDIRIHTLSEGDINELHVGLKGTMNALFLKDLANKVRRGQRGRAEASRAAGGLSYGYRVLREIGANGEVERGRREIDPEAARITRRIFEEYVAGRSPRAIAADLNVKAFPAHGGLLFAAPSRSARHEALQLYAGKMEYGRLSYRRDPDTGSRQPRVLPQDKWVLVDVPEWRIVSEELWREAQTMRMRHTGKPSREARRPRHLLSGLIPCGQWRRQDHEIERSITASYLKVGLTTTTGLLFNGGEPSAGRAQGASIDAKPVRGVREAVSRDI
jgi:DNA invertase Pin-like site-specific DNA recombinase